MTATSVIHRVILLCCCGVLVACSQEQTVQPAITVVVPAESVPLATTAPLAATPASGPTATLATTTEAAGEQRYPDILDAELTPTDDNRFSIAVTVSSPYDTPERYADAWRIVAPDGSVLGERVLLHDHASEQPFTRSLDDLEIPAGIASVVIEGRDKANGYGGKTVEIAVPGR